MKMSSGLNKLFLYLAFSVVALGCVQRQFNKGSVKEALGQFNSPESMGLSAESMNWDNIKDKTRGARDRAWSDTWWPHYYKGLADRYILRKSGKNSEFLAGRGAILSKFVQQYLAAVESKNPKELALLSPAEKYDYLMSSEAIPTALLTQLDNYSKKHMGSKNDSTLISLENKLERLGEYDDSYKTLNQEYAREAKASATAFIPMLKEGMVLNSSLKKYLPMTSHDWNLWLDTFSWAHDEEWAWMGICNGWSPAALREQKPRQSVMVSRGGKKVLLTEGDIRGLLSWAWGWQFPNQTLGAGVRCDANESRTLVKNRRIIDGRLCEGQGSRPGRCVAANTIFIGNDDPFAGVPGRVVTFGLEPQSRQTHQATLKAMLGQSFFEAEIKELKSGEKRTRVIQITQACRDLNPGLFHAALVELVGRRKTGFVVDADRYTQVWNQPVFAYEMTYLPILKRDGSVSAPGTPVPVDQVKDDLYAEFRADKTSRLVQVRAQVIYASENGPFAQYDSSGKQETQEELISDYTLEIDSKGKIVGGEWGLLPGTPGVKPLKASNSTASVAPDFIWNYPDNAKPLGDLLNYNVVKKIHDCSISSVPTEKFDLAPWVDTPLPYVDCNIDLVK